MSEPNNSLFIVVLGQSGGHTKISRPRTKKELIELMFKRRWGTYGIGGLQPLKWVRLVDCSSEHLKNILKTQFHINDLYRKIINFILQSRKC
jgi:hypothetical protein